MVEAGFDFRCEKIVVFSLNILFRFRRWAGRIPSALAARKWKKAFRRFLFGGPEAAVVPDTAIARFQDDSRLRVVVVRPVCIFRFCDAIRFSALGTGRLGTRSHPGIRRSVTRRNQLAKLGHFWIFPCKI